MSGHHYDELFTLIGKLKRARIDAWMRENNWTVEDGEYTFKGYGMYGGELHVSRPDESGEGGGTYTATGAAVIPHDQKDDYTTAFATIRSAVDDHLYPWIVPELPKPTDIKTWWTPLRDASVQIAAQATLNGTIVGGGAMGNHIESFVTDCGPDFWQGQTAGAFRTGFVSQLGTAVAANHLVLAFLAAQVDAQRQMWFNARQSVTDIVVETTKAYDSVKGPSADYSVIIKIAGFAAAAAAVWASGGGAAVVAAGAAKVGVDVVSEINAQLTKEEQPAPSPTYDSVRDSMPKALEALSSAIRKEENAMIADLNEVYEAMTGLGPKRPDGQGRMAGSRDTFNLRRPALLNIDEDSDLSSDNLFVSPATLKEAVDGPLAEVVTRLHDADTLIYPVASKSPWLDFNRNSTIGLGMPAVMLAWCNVAVLLTDLLRDLKNESEASGETLLLLLRDITHVDVGSSETIRHQAKEVSRVGIGGVDYQRARDMKQINDSVTPH